MSEQKKRKDTEALPGQIPVEDSEQYPENRPGGRGTAARSGQRRESRQSRAAEGEGNVSPRE